VISMVNGCMSAARAVLVRMIVVDNVSLIHASSRWAAWCGGCSLACASALNTRSITC
jgi:hypothetical protein